MAQVAESSYQLVECMLPGVTEEQARALDRRVRGGLPAMPGVSYLGALLMPDDEVVFCLFAGPLEEVRAVSEQASVRFERIVPCRPIGLLAPRASDPSAF
ncbi:MAG: hypothetical protein ACLQNG_15615 [Acidimicrobiales bacterium]|jgi:hypothetical protein